MFNKFIDICYLINAVYRWLVTCLRICFYELLWKWMGYHIRRYGQTRWMTYRRYVKTIDAIQYNVDRYFIDIKMVKTCFSILVD